MSDINDGGPAFPVPHLVTVHGEVVNHGATGGMSLRDYFAAKAMGHLSQPLLKAMAQQGIPPNCHEVAKLCYEIADAMLAERAKGGAK